MALPGRPSTRGSALLATECGLYGFAVWTALVLGIAGKACTPHYSLNSAVIWWELYTLFGFIYWVPLVAVTGLIAFLACSRIPLMRSHPSLQIGLGIASLPGILFIAAAFTHQGRCVYL